MAIFFRSCSFAAERRKVPLDEMSKHTEEVSTCIAANSTAQHDADLAQRMTSSKTGLLVRAPAYVTEELATHLDIFTCVTAPLSRFYSHRTAEERRRQKDWQKTSRCLQINAGSCC